MRYFFSIAFLFIQFSLYSQGAFIFENQWQQCNAAISISAWRGGKEILVAQDTLSGTKIRIALPDSVRAGLLKIQFVGNCPVSGCEVIYNRTDIHLVLRNGPENQPWLDPDPETSYYWNTNYAIDSLRQHLSDLRKLMTVFYEDTQLTGLINSRYEDAIRTWSLSFSKIKKEQQFKVAPAILASEDYPIPDWHLSEQKQYQYIQENFFSVFDIKNAIFRRSGFFSEKIIDYLQVSTNSKASSKDSLIIPAIKLFFLKVVPDDTLTMEIAAVIRPWLLQNGCDSAAEYFDIHFLSTQCSAENNLSLQERIQAYKRMAKGQPAPEIIWVTPNGKPQSISNIPGKILIVFWASWCQHCEELLPSIYSYTQEKNLPVVAISLDQDSISWEKAIAHYPKWFQLRVAGGWNDPWVKLYGIAGTPTVFVLDENKNITGKSATLDAFRRLVE